MKPVSTKYLSDKKLSVELWEKAKAGDEEAFSQLFKIQYRVLFKYATLYTKDKDLIKDVIQNLFVYLWEKRASIDVQFFSSYLIRSLRNNLFRELKITDWQNGAHSAPMDEAEYVADDFSIEAFLIGNENSHNEQLKIKEAILALPKRQQEVLFLKFYEGLDNEKIAEIMDVNRQSVANFLYKALSSLKISLKADAGVLSLLLATFYIRSITF